MQSKRNPIRLAKKKKQNKKNSTYLGGWEGGSVVKNTCCSYKEPKFGF